MSTSAATSVPRTVVSCRRARRVPSVGAALDFAPACWLGAPCPGALRLPEAKAAADAMYGPRGVCFVPRDGAQGATALVVADSGNHRVLIWREMPTEDHQPADVVLGQPTMTREAPGLMHLPTGVAFVDGRLYVCDAWHHRVLIWNRLPEASNTLPDAVLGQGSVAGVQENRGVGPARDSMYWPYGIGFFGGRFFVCDTGNRRVLVWNGAPERDRPADFVIGQKDFVSGEENRGEGVGPRSFRWPHAVCGDDERVIVADAGNHRLLVWDDAEAALRDEPADHVLGQPDFVTAREWPYGPQGAESLRFPYFAVWTAAAELRENAALRTDSHSDRAGELFIADTANNRVLVHDICSQRGGDGEDADARVGVGTGFAPIVGRTRVLGQRDLDASAENRSESVARDSMCWPYGMACAGDVLAIADSGNNRVMLWRRQAAAAKSDSTQGV
jgi:hypothetical protein